MKILYEDNHIMVAIKPAGILSQGDISGDPDMLTLLKKYLKEKYQKPGNVYLGLVHRLDRRVSGVMVFARTSKAAARLSEAIRNHEFEKEYMALIPGTIEPKEGVLKHYLRKIEGNEGAYAEVCSETTPGAQAALLEYKVIKSIKISNETITLVGINLITGRYNQIRVQFSEIGHPLLNDYKYHYRGQEFGDELGLVCTRISFPHPTTKEILDFRYFPETGIWKYFKE